jgi:hypothetical protein
VTVAGDAAEPAGDSAPVAGGPLDMPKIGVVAPGFDERYAALLSASHTSPAPAPAAPLPTPSPTEAAPPAAPAPTSPPPVESHTSDDVTPQARPPVTPPAAEPPAEAPPAEEPPAEEPPAEEPPAEEPPAEEPPAEEPPAEAPPTEAPPEDVDLALGETFDVLDASGQLSYTIVVDAVTPDVVCTAEGSLPAENGHLIGLELRVITGPAPAEGTPAPAISTSDFGVTGADGEPAADAETASAEACLGEAEDFPSTPLAPEQETAGTVVLDVAAVTGTITYRPEGLSLLWRF